jgi:hypothetical protein
MANASTATVTIPHACRSAGHCHLEHSQRDRRPDRFQSPTTTLPLRLKPSPLPPRIKLESFSARPCSAGIRPERPASCSCGRRAEKCTTSDSTFIANRAGQRVQLNPSLIAGSALAHERRPAKAFRPRLTPGSIRPPRGAGTGSYWLEDVDVNGTRALARPGDGGHVLHKHSGCRRNYTRIFRSC